MDDNIIPFKPRTPKAHPVAPTQDRTFWMDQEVAELTLSIPKADPAPPRVRY
ncbi:MAG: hypothetical protein JWM80_3094 [Cyanobacteria bacterium RYN_339]|nr:hypothetical protein [Cyanobacteria bacterium RYN_339]